MRIEDWLKLSEEQQAEYVKGVLEMKPLSFRKGFTEMILSNLALVKALVSEINKVKGIGREYYSMRTIIEFMRHHSTVNTGGNDFKINNNYHTSLNSLVIGMFPELDGFFRLRGSRVA